MPLSEISPALVDAFLLKEDRWFYWHPGVNPVALVRAAFRTYSRRLRQGGSTLTMQLARLIYRVNTRTPAGKLRQIAAALWLEARYSKRELLEAYLNVVPFGGNIQGVGAASRIYFGKPPDRLTLGEALTLAVIPQRPCEPRRADAVGSAASRRARAARTPLAAHGTATRCRDRRQLDLPIVASQHDSRCPGRRLISSTRCSRAAPRSSRAHRHHDRRRACSASSSARFERYLTSSMATAAFATPSRCSSTRATCP